VSSHTSAARALDALGDPTRRAIFELLVQQPSRCGHSPTCCRSAGRRSPSTWRCSRSPGSCSTERRARGGS